MDYKHNGLKSPLWSGLFSPLFSPFDGSAIAGGGGITYFYVDSVNGSDSNDGTAAAPFQTLAKVQATVAAGEGIALVRGSHWREQLDVPANNISIIVAGSGDMPVIDGADIVTTGWTQPDAVTYPNVWSRSWTRSGPASTASEYLGYWEAGARTTHRTTLANLQAGNNGDWNTTSFTAATATVSIRAAADPNSDGILREITKRNHAINSKDAAIGGAANARNDITVVGPIEAKRCVGHSNALAMISGLPSKLLLRDGNVHHTVCGAQLVQDVIATESSPDIAPGLLNGFRSSGIGHNPVWRRCGVLLPGGASRGIANISDFYAHATVAGQMESWTLEGCFSRGAGNASVDAQLMTISGFYSEDSYQSAVVLGAVNNSYSYLMTRDTAQTPLAAGNPAIRRLSTSFTFTAQHCAFHNLKGRGILNTAGGTKPVVTNCAITGAPSGGLDGGEFALTYSIIAPTAICANNLTTSYTGDYNVWYFAGQPNPQFRYNSTIYNTLATFQAASGQDANSVFLKAADQVSGNGIAFWLGVANGENNGPPDGDWRVNPSARVYNGAGATLSGVFADGVTPITMAGPQGHWDFNQRAVVSGPPSRYPVLPATVAEMRTYIENPEAWDFYP